MRKPTREPFFHQGDAGQLLGVYHNPGNEGMARIAVVICAPIGDEYFEYHRTMVLFADMLANAGIPCVRFDYSGCGDSEGSIVANSIELWHLSNGLHQAKQWRKLILKGGFATL